MGTNRANPIHSLCIDLNSRLTTLEQNYVLIDNTLKEEVSTMKKDLGAIQKQLPELQQFLNTTPVQLQTLTKQVGTVEELLQKMHESFAPFEPAP